MFAFQHVYFCAYGNTPSAEAGDERHDGLHVFLILRFVFDPALDNETGRHMNLHSQLTDLR